LLHLFQNDSPHTRSDTVRGLYGALYAVVMAYCFLGVSIIADMFMDAITVITSRRRRIRTSAGSFSTVKVWNETVATLSLMALGSSAPEICISLIELLKRDFQVGALGPSTIVGSAAFNLLVIVAVCMLSIPLGEVRRIQALPVFYVTAFFSVGGYLWLVFILTIHTVDVVDIWEAAATLVLLPVLIWISYKTDTGDLLRVLRWATRRPAVEADETPNCQAVFSFSSERMTVRSSPEVQLLEAIVLRSGDCKGCATCSFHTERFAAVPDCDFVEQEGELEFAEGVREISIQLSILPKIRSKAREFLLVLDQPSGGGFSPDSDGGTESAILTITIAPNVDANARQCLCGAVSIDSFRYGLGDWLRQSSAVFYCNGSAEEQRTATCRDWIHHVACLPWKLLFLPVPPSSLCGGWLCFFASLLVIAMLTGVLSDLAELFGCMLDVPDIITALTFVALGTSMPDLFASLTAARDDPTADAAIINVTGSNAVNVFLGLGLPWTMGAIYWAVVGPTPDWKRHNSGNPWVLEQLEPGQALFVVDSRNLGFSVLILCEACVVALVLLFARRHFLGAEFGGPWGPKVATCISFIFMWLGFCGVVSWRVLRWEQFDLFESLMVMVCVGVPEVIVALFAFVLIARHGWRQKPTVKGRTGPGRMTGSKPPLPRSMSKLSFGSSFSVAEEEPTKSLGATVCGSAMQHSNLKRSPDMEAIADVEGASRTPRLETETVLACCAFGSTKTAANHEGPALPPMRGASPARDDSRQRVAALCSL